ncbi:LVIVD repeat-containing protein [Parabacteroides sp.]
MKKLMYLFWAAVVCLLSGCLDDDGKVTEKVTVTVNKPVFMPADVFRSSVHVKSQPEEITQQGKICFYEGYLYISEPGKGIHIIDNRNPSSPTPVGFIELIGNADVAIRNNMLYADSYVDLVWFDISNPALPVLKDRLEDVFIQTLPPIENGIIDCDIYSDEVRAKGVVVGWTQEEMTYTREYYKDQILLNDAATNSPSGSLGSSTGVNGSMSRFGLYKDYLYVVLNDQLSIFNLAGAEPEKAAESIWLSGSVETIFSYKDCLFMGTPTGMMIYSVADPLKPEYQSLMWHVYGCDPVVVENDIAYVTVHAGNNCGQNNNELIILDVSNVKSPQPIVSYTMTKPKGLGIDNGTLFLCDDGLKVFDAKDPQTLLANRLAHYSGMEGYDVIPHDNVLMMIADDGIYQYDYSNPKEITMLSKLVVKK